MVKTPDSEKKTVSVSSKRRLLDLIRANETLKEELKRHQIQLLKIVQDNYFLHERLLPHEKKEHEIKQQREAGGGGAKKTKLISSSSSDEDCGPAARRNLVPEAPPPRKKRKYVRRADKLAALAAAAAAKETEVPEPAPVSSSSSTNTVFFSSGFSKSKSVSSLKRAYAERGSKSARKSGMASSSSATASVPIGLDQSSSLPPLHLDSSASNSRDLFPSESFASEVPGNLFDQDEDEDLKIDEDSI